MGQIVLARIDDRLIHGQVMTAWLQYSGGNEIIIIDDQVANDLFLKSVIKGAVPKHVEAQVLTVTDATSYLLQELKEQSKKFILLAKGPETFYQLITNGIPIDAINLGGMGSKQGRKKLYKNIATSESEKEAFRKILSKNVSVYIQVVPNSESVELTKFL